jgi:hypothetical protein
MIRILYNNGVVGEYESTHQAKLMVAATLFVTRGKVLPVEAVEVLGTMPSGEIVERVLDIKFGVVELD